LGGKLAKRRGNGEGSVYRRKDGLWVGQYKIEVEGKARTKYLYAKTRKDAAAKLNNAVSEREKGRVYYSGSLSVEQFFLKWLESIKGSLRASTVRRYESVCRVHIFPSALGERRLDQLTPLQLQTLYQEKLASGLSVRSVQIIHATLHKGLGQAVRWSLIPGNIASLADQPKYRRKDINPFSEEQVKVLLDAAKGDGLEALYILAVTTGLRKGEILALKWEDVDLGKGTLRVRRTLSEGGINPPKTKSGKRNIQLSRAAIESLNKHQRYSNWVFCTSIGTPIQGNNLYNRHFKPLLKKAGLPHKRFHDLRHTCATLLLVLQPHFVARGIAFHPASVVTAARIGLPSSTPL
jgi:integrase